MDHLLSMAVEALAIELSAAHDMKIPTSIVDIAMGEAGIRTIQDLMADDEKFAAMLHRVNQYVVSETLLELEKIGLVETVMQEDDFAFRLTPVGKVIAKNLAKE